MSKTRMVLLRITGSVVGLLAVGVVVGVALFFILIPFDPDKGGSWEGAFPMFIGFLAGVVASTVGAAAGATITQRFLRQRSSFWRASLGAVVGLVVGALCGLLLFFVGGLGTGTLSGLAVLGALIIAVAAIVAGAVIGSGWKAKPRDAASPSV